MDLSSKKSIIETVYLKNEQGNVIEVCFDITDYRKKFNELHKKEIIKISRDLRKQKERVKEDKEPGSSYDFHGYLGKSLLIESGWKKRMILEF